MPNIFSKAMTAIFKPKSSVTSKPNIEFDDNVKEKFQHLKSTVDENQKLLTEKANISKEQLEAKIIELSAKEKELGEEIKNFNGQDTPFELKRKLVAVRNERDRVQGQINLKKAESSAKNKRITQLSAKEEQKEKNKRYEELFWVYFQNGYVEDKVGAGKFQSLQGKINNQILQEHTEKLATFVSRKVAESPSKNEDYLLKDDPETAAKVKAYLIPLIKKNHMEQIITNQEALVNFFENLSTDLNEAKLISGIELSSKLGKSLAGYKKVLETQKQKLREMKQNPDKVAENHVDELLRNSQFSQAILQTARKTYQTKIDPQLWREATPPSTLTNVRTSMALDVRPPSHTLQHDQNQGAEDDLTEEDKSGADIAHQELPVLSETNTDSKKLK